MTLPVPGSGVLPVAAAVAALIAASSAAPVLAQPAVLPATPPRDPAPTLTQDVPTQTQVSQILLGLADPDISDAEKNNLVQGGIGNEERKAFKRDRLKKAAARGQLPVTFLVGNIWPVGPDTAAAEVTVTGGKTKEPAHKVFTFVKRDQWMLSSDSAAQLIDTVKA